MHPSDPKTKSGVLSRREMEVLRLGAQGATDSEISDRLSISVPTLRTYWLRIRDKVGGINRTHAIAGPLADHADPQHCLLDEARTQCVAQWGRKPSTRQVLLEDRARDLFGIGPEEASVTLDRLLNAIWTPDRPRLERFLLQSAELSPMTPIEHRIGASGDFRHTIRTVNLSVHRSRQGGSVILLASAPSGRPS